MKNREVNNKYKNKYGKLNTILSIFYFKLKIFPYGILTKQKDRLCSHVGIKQWGVNYCEKYASVVNWISVRSPLAT